MSELERIEIVEQEYLDQLVRQYEAGKAALDGFVAFIGKKYNLREGDNITPDGAIRRADLVSTKR